jgi:hypothetical protein
MKVIKEDDEKAPHLAPLGKSPKESMGKLVFDSYS